MANLCDNPGIEVDADGWFGAGSVSMTRVTSEFRSGVASLESDCGGIAEQEGCVYFANIGAVGSGELVSVRCWLKGASGSVGVTAFRHNSGPIFQEFGPDTTVNLNGSWQEAEATLTTGGASTGGIGIAIRTPTTQNITFYADDAEVYLGDFPVVGQTLLPDADVAAGGWTTTPLHSKLADSSDATVITATAA